MEDAPEMIAALVTILTEHGPLADGDIAEHLRVAGVTDPDSVIDDLLDECGCPVAELPDGRWVWLPTLLAGRVFTHRLTAAEITHDLLHVTPDLDPVTELCQHSQYQQLSDGAPVQSVLPDFDWVLLEQRGIPEDVIDDSGALLLPPGTLTGLGVTAGDLVGLRLSDDGLALEPVSATTDTTAGSRLAAVLDADEPTYLNSAVWAVCAADPTLFTMPVAPLGEIADRQGLSRDGEQLAPEGFDFARWHFEGRCMRLAARYGLEDDDAFALTTLIEVHGLMARALDAADDNTAPDDGAVTDGESVDQPGGTYAEILGELGAVLAHPLLAEILMEETTRSGRQGAAALGLFAETLEPKVPRAARVATRWLRAVACERLGDIAGAEHELLAAEAMDPDWPLPLFDLARIASDRGDAETGLDLLRRAGADSDHPLVHLLEQHRAQPRNDVGRNEPCWCGSGRKYKKCHLGNEQLALTERVGWLYAKAQQHVVLGEWRGLLAAVGYERSRYDEQERDDLLAAALADPLAVDAVLFEGTAFEDFLELRGELLPDDERLLAQQWLLVRRSVFDVEQVQPGHSITVRDVRTGDVHEVIERTASRMLQPGQLICARVVPTDDDVVEFFGGIEPVALHQRGPLIELLDSEPDPVELVAFLTRRFAPPTLVNTEGDPMVLCEARVRVSTPIAVAAELDECYERTEDDPPRWIEFVTTDGQQRVRAGLGLDGDTATVETNSEARMDRVLGVLHGIDPALEVLEETRTPMSDLRQAAAMGATAALPEPDDPELLALMEKMIREHEERWLDESIPALDGATPRHAADDPTRRGDLIKLLDTFPSGAAAGRGMDADRLRAALGLA
ncbi:SEC-C metal-binding domain-containing protein [Mycobacterium sp. UM_WGJ]|uniref:SEC-C metal-binding domain-containing protein n=1 Tax=Mycobacterium sp. UM_WGJ TaxID=1370120 RepID=UPI0004664795